ncbi:MAG: LysM peptidoglycan-binding domain-containing protein [Bacteroidales bacterium]|nr:LysM peptidoglycan-binding domain-containing protein [Bacteroidales bacterium]MCF8333436.1 LysM peptidoglycan-binding domain-containing protein [Bacteroidales bacterium]
MRISIQGILIVFFITIGSYIQAQDSEPERSSIIETIEGRDYYIHLIQPSETLEELGELYGVSPEVIIRSTPSLDEGKDVRPNQILRIPVSEASNASEMEEQKIREAEQKKEKYKPEDTKKGKDKTVDTSGKRKIDQQRRFAYHKVAEGETLFSISREYGVNVEQIKQFNPGIDDNISIGQSITIPVYLAEENEKKQKLKETGVFRGKKFNAYTVKKGETIYRIAKNFGISQQELLEMNPQIEVNSLKAGTNIRIPMESDQPINKDQLADERPPQGTKEEKKKDTIRTYRFYKVKFLERVPGISKRQNIDKDTIYKLNPGIKEEGVNWGDIIKLPRKAEVQSEVYEKEEPGEAPSDTTISFIIHRVTKQENLYKIAKLYDVNPQDIIRLNPGAAKQINKGEKLKIPIIREKADEPEDIEKEEKEKEKLLRERCLAKSGVEQHFKVALMVPLYLSEYTKLDTAKYDYNPPEGLKSMNFIQFYEGALLALDSLESRGLKAEVFVYDIGKSREEAIRSIDSRLEEADLIIGPVYNEPFQVIAEFAQQHDIKIVNPLSTRESIIKEFKHVYKVQSPEREEMKAMAEYIEKHYPDTTDIYIIRDNKYIEQENLSLLTDSLQPEIDSSGYSRDAAGFNRKVVDVKYSSDSLNPVLGDVDSLRKERKLIVALTHNRVFSIELLRHLNQARDSIGGLTVFGKSSWRDYGLDSEYLLNLDVHLFDDEYIDYDAPNVKWFLHNFRERYHTEPLPERFAFVGFDVMYYFGTAMLKYGEEFSNCLKFHQSNTLETFMEFRKNGSGSYENVYSMPLRYYNYKLMKLDKGE